MTELAAITEKILRVPVGFLSMQNNPELWPAFKNIKCCYWRACILQNKWEGVGKEEKGQIAYSKSCALGSDGLAGCQNTDGCFCNVRTTWHQNEWAEFCFPSLLPPLLSH